MRQFLLAGILAVAGAPVAHADRAQDCLQAQDPTLAITACSKIISDGGSGDSLVAAYSNRGASYADLGQFERALEDYKAALDLNPQHTNTVFNRGNAHCALGMTDNALEDYLTAIELNEQAAIKMQEHLKAIGDYNGPADGQYRPSLELAMRAWVQRSCRR